jgi:hypothetical protein
MMNEIRYKQLLDLDWALRSSLLKAESRWNQMYERYGKDGLLYELTYDDVKELREARKTLAQVVSVLGNKKLYSY